MNHYISKFLCAMLLLAIFTLSGCQSRENTSLHDTTQSGADKQQTQTTQEEEEILEEPLAVDAAYCKEHWPDQKTLVWVSDMQSIDTNIIVALNDLLVEQGYDFVIQFQQEDCYAENYLEQMQERMQNKEQIDLFNIGGNYEGESDENKYEKAVEAGLLYDMKEYLGSDSGKVIKATFCDAQWDAMTKQGGIYGYDWRRQPVRDLCVFVNKEQADAQGIHVDDSMTLKQLCELAQTYKTTGSEGSYPIIWDCDAADWNDTELSECYETYQDSITDYSDVNWEADVDFFILVKAEDFCTSDEQTLLLQEQEYEVQKMTLAKDQYEPVYQAVTGIASWSENKKEALTFLTLINTEKEYADLLQYGVEGVNYEIDKNGKVVVNYDQCAFGDSSPGNKWITKPQGMETENKEKEYRSYLEEHLK